VQKWRILEKQMIMMLRRLAWSFFHFLEDKKSGIYVDNVANFCILGKKEGRESTIHDPENQFYA